MKVQTIHWGEIEAEYWRDDQGREGLRCNDGGPPLAIIASDLMQPRQWPALMMHGARGLRSPGLAAAPTPTDAEKLQAARDRMANARAARKFHKKEVE